MKYLCTVTLAVGLLAASPTSAADGPFSSGKLRGSVGGGYNGATQRITVGGGLGYFLYDGLLAELDGAYSFNADPSYWMLSPGVRYVAYFVPVVHPYVGVFYRRLFFEEDGQDSVGARGGAFLRAGRHVFVGAGVLYEKILDCPFDDDDECSLVWPEISFGISF